MSMNMQFMWGGSGGIRCEKLPYGQGVKTQTIIDYIRQKNYVMLIFMATRHNSNFRNSCRSIVFPDELYSMSTTYAQQISLVYSGGQIAIQSPGYQVEYSNAGSDIRAYYYENSQTIQGQLDIYGIRNSE